MMRQLLVLEGEEESQSERKLMKELNYSHQIYQNLSDSMEEEEKDVEEMRGDEMVVVISEVHLDKPNVVEKLSELFIGFDEMRFGDLFKVYNLFSFVVSCLCL